MITLVLYYENERMECVIVRSRKQAQQTAKRKKQKDFSRSGSMAKYRKAFESK